MHIRHYRELESSQTQKAIDWRPQTSANYREDTEQNLEISWKCISFSRMWVYLERFACCLTPGIFTSRYLKGLTLPLFVLLVLCTPPADACPRPRSPVNGVVLGNSFASGSTISYTCNDGYQLIGETTQQCKSDLTWSGRAPTCERKLMLKVKHTESFPWFERRG